MDIKPQAPELSVVLPCRNEEESLKQCILKIKEVFRENNIDGEIIVSDSSNDNSPKIAEELGVVLVKHDKKGYGIAYLEGFKAAQGKYIFCADPDSTYNFGEIPKFLNYLKKDYDFVIGDRFAKQIEKNAMPWLHQYIGNPVLSFLFRIFFKAKLRDVHCGMRAIKKRD